MSYVLMHGFVAKQACLILWLSKPTFLSNHQFIGVSQTFSTYSPPVGLTFPLLGPVVLSLSLGAAGMWSLRAVVGRPERLVPGSQEALPPPPAPTPNTLRKQSGLDLHASPLLLHFLLCNEPHPHHLWGPEISALPTSPYQNPFLGEDRKNFAVEGK